MSHQTSRADLHCHSTASELSKLGVQRALGLPECATPPEEVLELAQRRGMDFITITDHDTIDGVLQIADDPRVFLSEEATLWFKGEPQAVHVLCLGITPDDHEWIQAHNHDVELVAEELQERGVTCALAHPFYAVEAPLTPRHRRRLAQLFPIWETRNGSRARELNAPAAVYIETHGGTGVAGSDDHAGVDIGRTFTEVPRCATPEQFLHHIREGRAAARGDQGSAAKWAHAAMAIAVRALGRGDRDVGGPNPLAIFKMVDRIMREGDARRGAIGADLAPDDARALLRAWLDAVGLEGDTATLLARLQDDGFRHDDLFRKARAAHERALAGVAKRVTQTVPTPATGLADAVAVFDACIPAIPYAPAAAFLGREKAKLTGRDGEPQRVALVVDGVGSMHGVTHTLDELRQRGVPGFEVEVVTTDAMADRRLGAVADVEVPFYPGLQVGVPSLPGVVEVLAEGRYDLVHVCSPGPAGIVASLVARIMDVPVLGSYHTELATYTAMRTADPGLEALARQAVAAFYGQCQVVLSPSPASDEVLRELGIPEEAVGRWDRGVDVTRFSPAHRTPGLLREGAVNVLYAGRLTHEKGADLLADAFLAARAHDPRLHLNLAGGGPEEAVLRERLGEHATFLGWLDGDDLARAYASADVFLFASRTDTFGQVLLEAQASGLPVVAVAEGGPCSIVTDGVSGRLCPADAQRLGATVADLARDGDQRARLARGGLDAVTHRTWEAALGRLAEGYRRALAPQAAAAEQEALRAA
ncbi:glycosyltransferase [Conexibacter sp. SYSU D00693]|uniref:glycosyltransferase n=1 Tax=Conexibacter sp. SYSU D00693 TaxID=2812560 RepID=UPI00196AC276|nr:glycosyltransferase [Conexibacter sp. SYSU D00693]